MLWCMSKASMKYLCQRIRNSYGILPSWTRMSQWRPIFHCLLTVSLWSCSRSTKMPTAVTFVTMLLWQQQHFQSIGVWCTKPVTCIQVNGTTRAQFRHIIPMFLAYILRSLSLALTFPLSLMYTLKRSFQHMNPLMTLFHQHPEKFLSYYTAQSGMIILQTTSLTEKSTKCCILLPILQSLQRSGCGNWCRIIWIWLSI